MRRISSGAARHLVRRVLPLPGQRGIIADMPGSLGSDAAFGLKCLSIRSQQPGVRSPHQGFLTLFEPTHGEPIAVLEAGAVTAFRTAAATALATRSLARASARTLAILGAGEQAEYHIPALLEACDFSEIILWARGRAAAEALAENTRRQVATPVRIAASAQEAAQADVVCTLTSADVPIVLGEWVSPGTHINLVGSSGAGPREVDSALVRRSRYFVDSIESALTHASEFRFAKNEGLIGDGHIRGEIGAVLAGEVPGRLTEHDVTVYKSLGHIAQDLAIGWHLFQRAQAEGWGARVRF
jgi:ornithine cyclodeaminase